MWDIVFITILLLTILYIMMDETPKKTIIKKIKEKYEEEEFGLPDLPIGCP